jgi:hypothetical protein
MRISKLGLIAVIAGAVLTTIAAASPRGLTAVAETYYGCLPNYTFQVNGTNARCYKPGTVQTADIICGIGAVKAMDQFNGGKDGCQMKTNNLLTNYTCPTGYAQKVQPGPDMCTKEGTPSILAPSVAKSL